MNRSIDQRIRDCEEEISDCIKGGEIHARLMEVLTYLKKLKKGGVA